ncbi:MAG TPA: O-acetyl-ADP-ribose deacetylase [Candidatus Obscuribacterales bacterium]
MAAQNVSCLEPRDSGSAKDYNNPMPPTTRKRINATEIRLVQGDITKESVDAIVNAANSSLAGGGGVDGAIHRAGGPAIMEGLNDIKRVQHGCPTGSAVITGAGKLNAQYVIHAVGPRYRNGHAGESELLAGAYRTSLQLAAEAGAKTVAFPSISTGIYGYPVEAASRIAISTVAEFCTENDRINEIKFVLFDAHTFAAFQAALTELK